MPCSSLGTLQAYSCGTATPAGLTAAMTAPVMGLFRWFLSRRMPLLSCSSARLMTLVRTLSCSMTEERNTSSQ